MDFAKRKYHVFSTELNIVKVSYSHLQGKVEARELLKNSIIAHKLD